MLLPARCGLRAGLARLILILSILGTPALAEEVSPSDFSRLAVLGVQGESRIDGLTWNSETTAVELKRRGHFALPFVLLSGKFKKEDWALIYGERKLVEKEGEFTIELPLTGPVTIIEVHAVGPLGEVLQQEFSVRFDAWAEFLRDANEKPLQTRSITAGFGVSGISYSQSDYSVFSEQALTIKATYQAPFSQAWDYAITSYLTLLPVSSSLDNVSARFFGINGRVGRRLQSIPQPWSVNLMGGFYYASMFTSGESFGYKNLAGPMLFPVLKRMIGPKDAVAAYLKYSPITDGIRILALGNRELAMGLSWMSHFWKSQYPMSASVDYSNLEFTAGSTEVRMKTLTVGVAYTW